MNSLPIFLKKLPQCSCQQYMASFSHLNEAARAEYKMPKWQNAEVAKYQIWWMGKDVARFFHPATPLWRHCDTTVTPLWHHCDATVTPMWRQCDASAVTLWRQCDATAVTGRRNDSNGNFGVTRAEYSLSVRTNFGRNLFVTKKSQTQLFPTNAKPQMSKINVIRRNLSLCLKMLLL